jgi:hypothetical protein
MMAPHMSGMIKGVQALIQQRNPLAVYTHCCSHVLNLVILKSCSIPDIRNMFGTVRRAAVFFSESSAGEYQRYKYQDTYIKKVSCIKIQI